MAGSTFQTNPISLYELLDRCHSGDLQLPDFQRSWVWDEDRIKSLIASISRAFPVGALMTLGTGGAVDFKPRPVEGAVVAVGRSPGALILDGQQRLTSLYQATLRNEVVRTVTPRNKRVDRWFYIDMEKALDPSVNREDAVVGVPADKKERSDFGKTVDRDLSTRQAEIEHRMYPTTMLFRFDEWQKDYIDRFKTEPDFAERFDFLSRFNGEVRSNFSDYQIPVIALGKETSKEAVCVVFEKVNTGGKALDAFELITAIYAADGYELRKDWYGDGTTQGRLDRFKSALKPGGADAGILAGVGNTDFLQVAALFHTREVRRRAERDGKSGKDLPQIIGNRNALLDLPLTAYKAYQSQAEAGFMRAAKFLNTVHVFRLFELPYQSQVIPLAAILADIGDGWDVAANKAEIEQWYWCGVFGELYGSSTESRIARDFVEVPAWLQGGPTPSTVVDAVVRVDRLRSMRMRLSAAYKGVNALLMKVGARDFRSGQLFANAVFFDESVDIHHVFPQAWCIGQKIPRADYDSIVNKTPLAAATNRKIGGSAPTVYLSRLEKGSSSEPGIDRPQLDEILHTHLIHVGSLRSDDFFEFFERRQQALLKLISEAIGKPIYQDQAPEEREDVDLVETDEMLVGLAAD